MAQREHERAYNSSSNDQKSVSDSEPPIIQMEGRLLEIEIVGAVGRIGVYLSWRFCG